MKELALHLLDIIQNSIVAGSTEVEISIQIPKVDGKLELAVKDNGCGMDEETCAAALDPFHTSRTTRKVGLGLPLFLQAARLADGDLSLASQRGNGTTVTATFENYSLDRQPLGDIGNLVFLTIIGSPDVRLRLVMESPKGSFAFDSVSDGKGDNAMDVAFYAQELIEEQVRGLFCGVLPEMEEVMS